MYAKMLGIVALIIPILFLAAESSAMKVKVLEGATMEETLKKDGPEFRMKITELKKKRLKARELNERRDEKIVRRHGRIYVIDKENSHVKARKFDDARNKRGGTVNVANNATATAGKNATKEYKNDESTGDTMDNTVTLSSPSQSDLGNEPET